MVNDNSVVGVFDDGDWSTAAACSPPLVEFPFEDQGDSETIIIRQRFQQAFASYTTLPPLTPHEVYPQALFISDGPQRDLGGGKIEFERMWAMVPVTRQEPESFLYQYQFIVITSSNDNGAVSTTGALGNVPFSTASTVTYDYYTPDQAAAYPLEQAPRILEIASNTFLKIGYGDLHLSGSYVVSSDQQILAENDTAGRWKGNIFFRKRRQIAAPTVAGFWGGGTPAGSGGSTGPDTHLLGSVSVSPAVVGLGQPQTITLTGTGTQWTTSTTFGIVDQGFDVNGVLINASISNVVVDPTTQTATLTFTPPTMLQKVEIVVGGTGATPGESFNITIVPGFSLTPNSVQAGQSVTLHFAGVGTTWTAATVFTPSDGTLSNVVINPGAQTAVGTFTAPNAAEEITFTANDGSATGGTVNVFIPGFSVAPNFVGVGTSATLTFTGVNTAWTNATDFTPSAGTLSSLVVDVAAQTATANFTAPATAQNVTFTASDGSVPANAVGCS